MSMSERLGTLDRALDFLHGGGRVGALMRAHDWSQSPLGPPETWPQSLRSVVGLLLQSRFPMFVAWGKELGFLYNDPYAEILGAKHPRALGIRFYDIWSEIWSDISPLIDAAMAGEATYREDLPLLMNRRGFDEQTWFTFSYSPVRDESGKIAGMFCAVAETTGRVLAEHALRELNENLERRVEVALAERKVFADLVETTDTFVQAADLNFRWLAINKASADEFERLFGVRPQVGDSMLDLLADRPEHLASVRAIWSRALGGEEFTETGEFGDPSRERRVYEMKFNTLRDREGNRIGAYQFVQDVTQRLRDQQRLQQAEEVMRQAQKMESLGQLTGGVAHDFNNLLAVISAGLQMLQRPTDPARRQRIFEGMRHAVERGSGLTRQLLAFSRRRPLNPESIDLAQQIEGMREMLSSSLRGDVDVETKFGGGLWPVEVDAGELELAILNLCVNARDAMPDGGTIGITAENESGVDGDFVRLAVRDTGGGMPPEVMERVFEPFFTTKDVGKGSGLGLAQVYGFATQSAGSVGINSEPGRGTIVTLRLPRSHRQPVVAAEPIHPAAAVPVLPPQDGRRGHVLLVEDDKQVAALTREILDSIGFEVTHAPSAGAALDALAGGLNIDVVFSDIMMPGGMSGLDLARELRRKRPDLPVVLTTGYEGAAGRVEREGVALIRKPYEIEALTIALAARIKPTWS
jgi:PAS domain S-box-containing protein